MRRCRSMSGSTPETEPGYGSLTASEVEAGGLVGRAGRRPRRGCRARASRRRPRRRPRPRTLSSGSKSTRSPASTARACGPTATTRDQASRRPPMAAVAGMTMPPDERRSPDSLSSSTRIRSCSILMGVLSFPSGLGAQLATLRMKREQRDRADHAAGDLEDVVGARLPGRGVDEVGLDGAHLAAHDRLGAGAVEELVDRGRQALPGLLDLALEGGHLVAHPRRLPITVAHP